MTFTYFLAPPAERQRSFSNAELSVVRPSSSSSTFHSKSLFLRNCLITVFLLWYGALLGRYQCTVKCGFGSIILGSILKVRKVKFGPFSTWKQFSQKLFDSFSLFCHEVSQGGCWWTAKNGFNWITLKGHFSRSKKVKFGCFANFLQNGLITFFNFCVHSFLGMILFNCLEMDFIELVKRSFSRSKRSGLAHISHNYWYYSVVTKCFPNLLHHVASLLWNQSCPKIWKAWNNLKDNFQGKKGQIWTYVIYIS